MRWLPILMLATCTGESGGSRMMIDAGPGGTGGIGGTSGIGGDAGGCGFDTGGTGGCGCGFCPDAAPPIEIPSQQTVTFEVSTAAPEGRYLVTQGYYCDAFGIAITGGAAIPQSIGFQCLCECPNPGAPIATRYHFINAGQTYPVTWDARQLVTYSEPYDCAAHGWPGVPPTTQLFGVHQPVGPTRYTAAIPNRRDLPPGCNAIAGTADFDCSGNVPTMGAPPSSIQAVCSDAAATYVDFDLPYMTNLTVPVTLQ